ncbi:MAG: TlpA family protein disulfide reductase [Planctomycetota bacterium]|jgi:peroxiredoxin
MQRIVKRTFLVGGALALLCAGLAGCGSTKAKSWTFTDDEGSIRNLSDYEGQVLVLGFSNTWCEPCQEAALQMQSIQDRFRDQGVKVMTVSCWERGDADAYMQEHGYNYGVMLNGTKIAREYDVNEIPTFLVVGVDGKILSRYEGYGKSTPDKISKSVQKHLDKVARHPERYRSIAGHGG